MFIDYYNMNPFEQVHNDVELNNFELNKIEIWCEERGRKCITHVDGWNINDTDLKEHLKNIKNKRGCNGCVKDIKKEDGSIRVLQLQGNHKEYMIEYLKNQGVDEEIIKLKG